MIALVHGSCAVRDGLGVLIRGRPGSGKSDLLLRLLAHGFELVADDCVLLEDGVACAPERLRGLIEVRGLGIYRRSYCERARIGLVVEAGRPDARIPSYQPCPDVGVPTVQLDLLAASSSDVVSLAVACLSGAVNEIAGPLRAED